MGLMVAVLIFLVIFVVFYPLLVRKHRQMRIRALRNHCKRALRMPGESGEETIERYKEKLKEKYPNKSEVWYLEKIIGDLERSRR